MPKFSMTCDTFHRISRALSPSLPPTVHQSWNTLRIDNGCIIAGNRSFIAIEHFAQCDGVAHLVPDPALLKQCEIEAMHGGRINIVVNEMLGFATAKTTFGYQTTGNLLHQGEIDPDWSRWREIVKKMETPPQARGAMYWDAQGIQRLIESSPSGGVVFEERIDCERGSPILIRDVTDYNWLGCFHPFAKSQTYAGAILPSWVK